MRPAASWAMCLELCGYRDKGRPMRLAKILLDNPLEAGDHATRNRGRQPDRPDHCRRPGTRVNVATLGVTSDRRHLAPPLFLPVADLNGCGYSSGCAAGISVRSRRPWFSTSTS